MNYALLTENNLTDPTIAEENYEKDFRIRDTSRFHAGWLNGFRLHARPSAGRRYDQEEARSQGEERESQSRSCGGQADSDSEGHQEEIVTVLFL
jgi:hypothetical protein